MDNEHNSWNQENNETTPTGDDQTLQNQTDAQVQDEQTSAPIEAQKQEQEAAVSAAQTSETTITMEEDAVERAAQARRAREAAQGDTSSFAYIRDHAPLHGAGATTTSSRWSQSQTSQQEQQASDQAQDVALQASSDADDGLKAENDTASSLPDYQEAVEGTYGQTTGSQEDAAGASDSAGQSPWQTYERVGDQANASGGITPPARPRRKNSGKSKKLLATVLIAALCGGAVGGATGYAAGHSSSSQKSVGAYSAVTPQTTSSTIASEDGAMTASEIAAKAMPAVVGVYNVGTSASFFGQSSSDGTETAQGYGSGVLISDDGTIVTNYHVVEGASKVVVATSDGQQYDAEVKGTDATLDLAVLKIEGSGFSYVDIADSSTVQVGDEVIAIGNPLGDEFSQTVTNGIISGVDRKVSSEDGDLGLLQTNAAINSGNSGGALLNNQAQLIGINSMKVASSGVEGMGFAIPSNVVLDFVNDVAAGKTQASTQKAWLGIQGYNMDETMAQRINSSQTTGILVANVTSGGPAEEGGLQAGDIIVGVDDTEVTTFDDLTSYLGKKAPGDQITLSIVRGDQKGTATVTLGQENTLS